MSRWSLSFGTALLYLAGIVLGAFSNDALPASYLYRPLAIGAVVCFVSAFAAIPFRRHAPLAAVIVTLLVVSPRHAVLALALGLVVASTWIWRRRTINTTPLLATIGASWVIAGLVPSLPTIDLSLRPESSAPALGRPMYFVLLDGYPRADELAELGVDNQPFVEELATRGFDHYPNAHSAHGWTVLTLTALLGNDVRPDQTPTLELKREVRRTWEMPEGFFVIDPTVGHVVIPNAPRLRFGGINDLEAHLIGQSIIGQLARGPARAWLGSELRRAHVEAFEVLGHTDARRVFAHVIAPHPPFVWGSDPTAGCWPDDCHLYSNAIEPTGVTLTSWAEAMRDQLAGLNRLVLDAVDEIVRKDSSAVIILFSDHGGRYSYREPSEWHHSFLAARTPGRPRLFGDMPYAHTVLDTVLKAYSE